MIAANSADRNLLCGILALQMDFVNREQLIAAMHAWVLQKETPLAELLRQRGWLAEEDRDLLSRMVERHLARHDHTPRRSLAAAAIDPGLRDALGRVDDADIQASLAPVVGLDSRADGWATVPPTPSVGGVRFRRLRPHARGGLGEVFVAVDEELHREVALKEIQSQYADHSASRARFVREAEVTGQLEHPGVVPIYGLGSYPDGRPYYAMRFIRGESLQDAIRRFHEADHDPKRTLGERGLELRRLLSHFVAVCNAVAYAHSRGVIHRDLKPANVMLGEYGETVVVDWGLAKVLDETEVTGTLAERPLRVGAGSGSAPTEAGRAMGTPSYMPPEQAQGKVDQVGVASDLFSLGATLYDLLTGRPPYTGPDALRQAERGRATPPRQVNRRVPPALESVCQRAMATRAEERYGSVKELAREVERWQADEAVEAHRDSALERMRRWGRRNRAVVSSLGALLVAGVIGLAAGLYAVNREKGETVKALGAANTNLEEARVNLRRAERAETEANTNLREAKSNLHRATVAEGDAKANLKRSEENLKLAKSAVDECFGVARGHPILQRDDMADVRRLLLDKAKPFYRNFQVQRRGDRAIDQEAATHLVHLGDIEENAGSYDAAAKLYRQARDAYAALARGPEAQADDRARLAEVHHKLALVHDQAGELSEAVEAYRQAIARYRDLLSSGRARREWQLAAAEAMTQATPLFSEDGDLAGATRACEQARRLYDHLSVVDPANYRVLIGTVWVRIRALHLLMVGDRYADSQLVIVREVGRLNALLKRMTKPTSGPSEMFWLFAPQVLEVLEDIIRREGGERYLAPMLVGVQQAYADLISKQLGNHAYQRGLARTSWRLGRAWHASGELAKAVEALKKARDIQARLLEARPESDLYKRELAQTLAELGFLMQRTGPLADGVATCYRACRMSEQLFAARPNVFDNRYALALAQKRYADLLDGSGQREAAVAMYRRAIDSTRGLRARFRAVPPYLELHGDCYERLAWCLSRLGRPEESVRAYQYVRDLRVAFAGAVFSPATDVQAIGRAHYYLSQFSGQARRWPASLRAARAAIRTFAQAYQDGKSGADFDDMLRRSCARGALALQMMGRPDDAVAVWDEVIGFATGPFRDSCRVKQAELLARLGRHQAAGAEGRAFLSASLPAADDILPGAPSTSATVLSGDDRYDLACAFALCCRAVGRDAAVPLPLRERLAERYAVQAVGQLWLAYGLGHFRDPENKSLLDRDADLDQLRGRADFLRFLLTIRTAPK